MMASDLMREKMAGPSETNLTRVWFVSSLVSLLLWSLPFVFGKYVDVTFPYVASEDIVRELVGRVGPTASGLRRCPATSPHLREGIRPLDDDADSLPDEDVADGHGVRAGGVWRPGNCESRYNVAIIIPYRNRSRHLQQFLTYMHPFLIRQQLSYRIVVVEQTGDSPLNRAKLLNVGFVETLKLGRVDCFVFHDVDLLPHNDHNIYACTHNPRHMYSAVSTFRYHLPYREATGGALAMLRVHFEEVNGFSNRFFGWGAEDDDLARRIGRVGLTLVRFDPRIAAYVMLSHPRMPPAQDRYRVLQDSRDGEDGLSDLSYRVEDSRARPLYTWFLVSF